MSEQDLEEDDEEGAYRTFARVFWIGIIGISIVVIVALILVLPALAFLVYYYYNRHKVHNTEDEDDTSSQVSSSESDAISHSQSSFFEAEAPPAYFEVVNELPEYYDSPSHESMSGPDPLRPPPSPPPVYTVL